MIDIHFHAIPGIDDGPSDLERAVELAAAAARAGVTEIVATPHVSWRWDNTSSQIAEGVQLLATRLQEEGVSVTLHTGAEIELTRAAELPDRELRALALGDGPWLLIELPSVEAPMGLEALLFGLQRRGHRIILAHIERCGVAVGNPELLSRFVDAGMLTSLTAGALVGRSGRRVKRVAEDLIDARLVHNVASDAHDCVGRPPGCAQELNAAGLGMQARWLTELVPRAIIGGARAAPSARMALDGQAGALAYATPR